MSALKILQQALADGLTLAPGGDGTIRVRGPDEARARWLPAIKASKADLLSLLATPRRLWAITLPDGTGYVSSFTPMQTMGEVLGRYAGATVEPLPNPDEGEPLPPDVEAAVLAWLAALGEDCPRTCREVLAKAQADPEARAAYLATGQATGAPGAEPRRHRAIGTQH